MAKEPVDENQPALTQEDLKRIETITKNWAMERANLLRGNVQSLGLVDSGKLLSSIRSGVRMSYGEAQTIWFKYQYWGLFHDKGANNVGRGNITLPAKHWMARYIYGNELQGLLDQLGEFYVTVTLRSIKLDDVKA